MTRSVLFVDDEPRVLSGLRRMLRSLRKSWDLHFVGSGDEALALLASRPIDVLVSDLHMPGVGGALLLKQVQAEHPATVRIVLSGEGSRDEVMSLVGASHIYLSKPCEPRRLKEALARALALQELVQSAQLRSLVARVGSLPSLPSLYKEIVEELDREAPSMARVATLIARDPAVSAKLLQLVNSAYFGLSRRVTNPEEAVVLLGLGTVRYLILGLELFSEFDELSVPGFSVAELFARSLQVGTLARTIARSVGVDREEVDDSFCGGLLHGIGQLVLAKSFGAPYGKLLTLVAQKGGSLVEAERRVLGAGHCAVGAYLLGLWGLPHTVVEAVAFYPRPRKSPHDVFRPITGVHVAASLCESCPLELDQDYLVALGLDGEIPSWTRLVEAD